MGKKAEPLSAKALAAELDTDPRTLRKFLRQKFGNVGQGKRWTIDGNKKSIEKIRKEFNAWHSPKPKKVEVEADDEAGEDPIVGEVEELDLEDVEDLLDA